MTAKNNMLPFYESSVPWVTLRAQAFASRRCVGRRSVRHKYLVSDEYLYVFMQTK